MNERHEERTDSNEDPIVQAEPNDENPALFFRIPAPPHFNDSWSLN